MKFGVTICHEGWRYRETVRWAAVRGANIVFHLQHTGSQTNGKDLTQWGATDEEGVLVQTIDPTKATGLLASRYAPERYGG